MAWANAGKSVGKKKKKLEVPIQPEKPLKKLFSQVLAINVFDFHAVILNSIPGIRTQILYINPGIAITNGVAWNSEQRKLGQIFPSLAGKSQKKKKILTSMETLYGEVFMNCKYDAIIPKHK